MLTLRASLQASSTSLGDEAQITAQPLPIREDFPATSRRPSINCIFKNQAFTLTKIDATDLYTTYENLNEGCRVITPYVNFLSVRTSRACQRALNLAKKRWPHTTLNCVQELFYWAVCVRYNRTVKDIYSQKNKWQAFGLFLPKIYQILKPEDGENAKLVLERIPFAVNPQKWHNVLPVSALDTDSQALLKIVKAVLENSVALSQVAIENLFPENIRYKQAPLKFYLVKFDQKDVDFFVHLKAQVFAWTNHNLAVFNYLTEDLPHNEGSFKRYLYEHLSCHLDP